METNPASWGDFGQFENSKAIIKAMKVVNDHYKRVLAHVQEYSELLNKGERQIQCFLQGTAEHRAMFTDSKKFTMTATRQQ